MGGGPPEAHVTSSGSTPVSMAGAPQRYLSSFSHRHMASGASTGVVEPGNADADRGLGMSVGVSNSLGKRGSGVGALAGDSPFKRRTASETVSLRVRVLLNGIVHLFSSSSSVLNHASRRR